MKPGDVFLHVWKGGFALRHVKSMTPQPQPYLKLDELSPPKKIEGRLYSWRIILGEYDGKHYVPYQYYWLPCTSPFMAERMFERQVARMKQAEQGFAAHKKDLMQIVSQHGSLDPKLSEAKLNVLRDIYRDTLRLVDQARIEPDEKKRQKINAEVERMFLIEEEARTGLPVAPKDKASKKLLSNARRRRKNVHPVDEVLALNWSAWKEFRRKNYKKIAALVKAATGKQLSEVTLRQRVHRLKLP